MCRELARCLERGLAVTPSETGGRVVVVEPVPQPVGGQAAAAFGEQEVGWAGAGAGPAAGRRAIRSSRAARVHASTATVRSVANLPSRAFSQLPRLAESHMQSSSRSGLARGRSVTSRSLTLDIQLD